MKRDERYDVIILGSGLAGTTLGTVLAKQGFEVLVLEKASHPRFAIGESMLPQSTMWMWILSQRFDIPEIGYLSKTDLIREHVAPTCGIKRVIGFVYHQEGQEQNPTETHQLIPPALPLYSESHFFRQDVDHYMLRVALQYGVTYRDHAEVTDFDADEDGVEVRLASGEAFRGRYLVDGTGFRSPLATKFGLREEPTRLRTHSRSIFTHLEGLRPYDETVPAENLPGLSRRWHDGTLHHLFDGGWFWVIPFGNHDGSENRLASIGLTLDTRKFPRREGITPEQEFHEIAARYPGIARHLEGAEAVRPWVGTGRLQYSAGSCLGPRFFLMSHAYGFVDALYSQGLVNTFETIHALSTRLAGALRDDDFSPERFAYLETLQRSQLDAADQMVFNSYRALESFHTWHPWIQTWLASKLYGDMWLFRSCLKFMEGGDPELFSQALEAGPRAVAGAPFSPHVQALIDGGEAVLDELQAGSLGAEEAGRHMLALLASCEWLPGGLYGWGDAKARHLDLQLEKLMGMLMWGKTAAPQHLREGVFDFTPPFAPPPGMEMPAAPQEAEMAQAEMAMATAR